MIKITCFGEVLWDVFPTHKKIGGAPLNVAVRLKSMKNDVSIISRVGNDEEGKEIVDFLNTNNINVSGIQLDSQYKTGNVKVMLNAKGSASYDIEYPSAWDKIEFTDKAKELTKASDVFVYGSLASRDQVSRKSLLKILKSAPYKVFDVNLRAPFYKPDILIDLMNHADFIKFNDEEIFEIGDYLKVSSKSLEQNIISIAEKTNTKCICVTKGRHGAILYNDGNLFYNSGYKIVVVDTVGAGDSFLGTLINKLMKKHDLQESIDHACAVGALVAASEGATPEISEEAISNLIGKK